MNVQQETIVWTLERIYVALDDNAPGREMGVSPFEMMVSVPGEMTDPVRIEEEMRRHFDAILTTIITEGKTS